MKPLFKLLKTEGDITYYSPETDVYVISFDLNSNTFIRKRVLSYTVHKNVDMVRITDSKKRFKPFSVSNEESIIVYDTHELRSKKINPYEAKWEQERYKLIQYIGDGSYTYIDMNDINMQKDDNTTAYDLTVEGTYTFCTEDGIVLQDTISVHFPMSEEVRNNINKTCSIDANLFSKHSDSLILEMNHDIVYGLFLLSKAKPDSLPLPLYKYMTDNKIDHIDKITLKEFLNKYIKDNPKESSSIIDELCRLGFMVSTRYNQALLSLDNIINSIVPLDKRKDLYDRYKSGLITMDEYLSEENKMIDSIRNKCVMNDIVSSGSRGNWNQLKQMFVQRGFVTDVTGKIHEEPIYKNLCEGLDSRSVFNSCYGVRKGLADIADNTAVSGTFTRKLIYASIGAVQGSSKKPCDTKHYLSLNVSDELLAKSLIGRYIFNDNTCSSMTRITEDNYKDFTGKDIRLRSPIFCTDKRFCHYCCPHKELSDLEKNKEYNVGLVAAATLSEPLTQLVLRTFHTSGSATKIVNGKEHDIVNDLSGIMRIFSKSRFKSEQDVKEVILKLFYSFTDKKFIRLLYFETLISCMMWKRNRNKDGYIKWRRSCNGRIITVPISKVPSYESLLHGAAFSNISRKLIQSIDKPVGATSFERIILNIYDKK